MNRVNENFLKLQNNYLFSTVAEKVEKYKQENPEKKVQHFAGKGTKHSTGSDVYYNPTR